MIGNNLSFLGLFVWIYSLNISIFSPHSNSMFCQFIIKLFYNIYILFSNHAFHSYSTSCLSSVNSLLPPGLTIFSFALPGTTMIIWDILYLSSLAMISTQTLCNLFRFYFILLIFSTLLFKSRNMSFTIYIFWLLVVTVLFPQ